MSQNKSWLATRLSGVPGPILGMANMLASASSISGINGFVVHLSYSMHVFEIAFFRQLFGFIFMSAVFLRGGLRPLMTRRFGLHVIRSVLNVIAMHREHAYNIPEMYCPEYLLGAAKNAWDTAFDAGTQFGYRNAQTTVLAPTGTIGFMMD